MALHTQFVIRTIRAMNKLQNCRCLSGDNGIKV